MKVLLKHGNTAGVSQYVGVKGELVLDRDTSVIRIMDGVTPGGHPAININYTIENPSITGPLNNATQVSCVPILTSSNYSGSGLHTQTEWVIARDAILQDIVYSSGFQDTHLTTLDLNSVNIRLDPLSTYYAAVRYKSSFGLVSGFSETIQFTTRLSIPETLNQTILPAWSGIMDRFGSMLSLSGDGNVLVVADAYNTTTNYTGGVYVYEKEGGDYIYKDQLIPFDQDLAHVIALGSNRGVYVSKDGSTIAITDYACRYNGVNASGCCWIFVKSGGVWVGQQRIVGPASTPTMYGNRFGANATLSEDGNLVAIPAYYDDEMGTNSGAVYVYKRTGSTWNLLQKLLPHVNDPSGQMGRNGLVASANFDTIICTSRLSTVNGFANCGRLFVFNRSGDTWSPGGMILPTAPSTYLLFGSRMALSDDGQHLLVGASGTDTSPTYINGYVSYYRKEGGTWWWMLDIVSPDGALADRFGADVAASGDFSRIAISASAKAGTNPKEGAIYLFSKGFSDWVFQEKIAPPVKGTDMYFGEMLGMSTDGTTLVAGLSNSDELYSNSGSVLVYK